MALFRVNKGTAQAPQSVGIGTSSTPIIPANQKRKWAVISNDGLQDCYLAFGETAVAGSGVLLKKNGGSTYKIGPKNFTNQAVNGVTNLATTSISYVEAI